MSQQAQPVAVNAAQPPPRFPAGTVTFLFTDIEGSTQLLTRLRDQYADLLAEHHRLLREVFARWHGREVDTQGDAFFVASEELATRARSRLTRSLTTEECRKYLHMEECPRAQ